MSEWNKNAGFMTWEERDYSKWAEERLKELLKAKGITIEGTEEVTATVLFLRGRKRVGYEFTEVKMRCDGKLNVVIPELSADVGEEYEMRPKTPVDASALGREETAAIRARINECTKQLAEELGNKVMAQ